jgi:hypothetical protein
MKHTTRSRLVAVAAIAALSVAGASAAGRTSSETTSSAADQIREAERTLLRAAVDGDIAAARRLLAADFQLIDVFGEPETRKVYLDTIAGAVDFVAIRPISRIKVRLYGNTAVARFQVVHEVVAGPDRLKHRTWTTDVFERRQGRWQLVWAQSTPTPNNPALLIQALKP